MAAAHIKQKNPGWLERLVARYRNESVLAVGYPLGTGAVGTRYPDGTSLVMVAAVQQYGSASRGIPARPFMTQGAPLAVERTRPVVEVMVRAMNAGKATAEQALGEMGPYAQAAFQDVIREGEYEPNSPVTIRRKESSQPLIDTGLLRNTLTWIVRKAA